MLFWRRVVLVAIVLGATACGVGPEPIGELTAGPTFDLVIEDGELVGGVRRERASIGDTITLMATGDGTDQIHIHGYDLYLELENGQGSIVFDALIPGRFEIEFEESGQLIIELTVR